MIEIKCTKKQKDELIKILDMNDFICDNLIGEGICESCDSDCRLCIEHNIKWDIQSEPLKLCPFCGGEAELIHNVDFGFYVIGKNCRIRSDGTEKKQETIEQWNGRVRNDRI